jgi:hypothetical protein
MFNKKSIIIVLVIIVIAIIGFIFIIQNKNWINAKKTQQLNSQNNITTPTKSNNLNAAIEETKKTDKDMDGLSDEQEKKLGTRVDVADTDGDGLMDSDEVNTYKTDPNKSDTDGDSFPDGYEVKRGYNPLGSGKL